VKLARWLLVFFAAIAIPASGHDLTGTWRAVIGPEGPCYKPFGDFVLRLKVDGDKLTGTVTISAWPGTAPIRDAKIEGDRFSFLFIGRLWSSSGDPRVRFAGTLVGTELKLSIDFGYVGYPRPAEFEAHWDLTGRRIYDARLLTLY
jgi:hypothetical protein